MISLSALKKLMSSNTEESLRFSGVGVVLMCEARDCTARDCTGRVLRADSLDTFNTIMSSVVEAVRKNGGVVHTYLGSTLVAYWPPSSTPKASRDAIDAATEAVDACGESVAVAISVGDLFLAYVGPDATYPYLFGPAYQHAEATLKLSSVGVVAIDLLTRDALPADIKARFKMKDHHAEMSS